MIPNEEYVRELFKFIENRESVETFRKMYINYFDTEPGQDLEDEYQTRIKQAEIYESSYDESLSYE